MNFEVLFLLFILGVMIFTQILKQMARKSVKKAEKPAAGWRKGLENILEEFRQEMETGRESSETEEKPARVRSWWEDLMPEEEAPKQTAAEAAPAESGRGAATDEGEKFRDEADSGFRQWGAGAKARQDASPAPERVPHPAKRGRLSRQDLRQAVIWSEILASPLGIRGPNN